MVEGVLLGVLEVDDVMLDQRIVLHLYHVKHKLPRHGVFSRLRKVYEVCHTLEGK